MGIWDELISEIPITNQLLSLTLLIINIFFPGIGTVIMSFLDGLKTRTLLVGIVQLFTSCIIIGYIWSIYWGIICIQKSKKS
jgi:hypothetical protein